MKSNRESECFDVKVVLLDTSSIVASKTFLSAKRCNTTRWSSTFEKMPRYCNIKHHLPDTDHRKVQELLLSEKENSDTDALLKRFTDFNSVTVELQSDCKLLVDCRVLFNGVFKNHPSMKDRLVINHQWSWILISKIQCGEQSELKRVRKRAT